MADLRTEALLEKVTVLKLASTIDVYCSRKSRTYHLLYNTDQCISYFVDIKIASINFTLISVFAFELR